MTTRQITTVEPPLLSAERQFQAEDWARRLLVASVVSSLFSIFVAGLAAAAGAVLWAWGCLRRNRWYLPLPPFTIYLGAFLALSLVSSLASPDVAASLLYLKKFLRFVPVILIFGLLQRKHLERSLIALYVVLGASALWGLLEYAGLKEISLLNRIDGFMSHWMTFSGQVMLGLVFLAGWGPSASRRFPRWTKVAVLLVWLLLATALILTLTRGAWLGAMAGMGLLLALRNWRWCVVGLAVVAVLYMMLPEPFHERVLSSFDLNDATTRGRIALLRTGLILLESSPWTGVGPRLVWPAALANRQEHELPDDLYQHLHNNPLQVAAELGAPALLAWLAIWLRIAWDLVRIRRRGDEPSQALASGGLAAMVAFHVMGLFEYNFGDSEISLLLFFLLLLPYLAAREVKAQQP